VADKGLKSLDIDKMNISIENEVFCFTGKCCRPRNQLQAIAAKAGASFSTSITNATTTLVCGNKNSKASKMMRAKTLGLRIITDFEFLALVQNKPIENIKSSQKNKTKRIKENRREPNKRRIIL